MWKNFLFSPVLPVDQGMLQDELFSTIHTDRGVTESKLVLLTVQEANKLRDVGARDGEFIWKASRLRRWQTRVPKNSLP